jgi:general stress protein 26
MNWIYKVKVRHLLTEKEDYESIQKSMSAIADILKKESYFIGFKWLAKFKKIPKGDDVIRAVDYGNNLLDKMYDYADQNRIWIE